MGALTLVVLGNDPQGALWTGALLGAVLGFLRHNLSEKRIFLGDAGSMLLGLWLAGLALGLSERNPGLAPIAALAMIVPVIDTSSTILRRWRRRVSVFRPDAEHLHHRLLQLGTTPRRATFCLWAITLAAAGVGARVLGVQGAGILALGALSAAAIELAYTIQQDRHPRLRRVFGYLLGIHSTLFPIDPAEHLADVIEMTSYRRRRGASAPNGPEVETADAPAAATGASELSPSGPVEEPATSSDGDVVLAIPKDAPR